MTDRKPGDQGTLGCQRGLKKHGYQNAASSLSLYNRKLFQVASRCHSRREARATLATPLVPCTQCSIVMFYWVRILQDKVHGDYHQDDSRYVVSVLPNSVGRLRTVLTLSWHGYGTTDRTCHGLSTASHGVAKDSMAP